MNNKKVLFLLGDIWSMKKGQGMPAVYKILEKAQNYYDIDVFTTDKHTYANELSQANIIYFKHMQTNIKNKYFLYLSARINNLVLNLKYITAFIKLNKKFDLVYCSSSIPILATYFIKKIYRVKTVHRIYGTFLFPKLGDTLDQIKKFEEVLSFKIEANGYIITNDGTFGDKVAEYYNISQKKYFFLRNGVTRFDIKETKQEILDKYSLQDDSIYILSVSRLVNWKRVDRIVSAMNILNDIDFKLIVVGDGPELESLSKLSINENTYFVGSISGYEVQSLMNVVDIFVSMYDLSNVGNPLLEALSYSLPIITYDSGNTSSVIDNNNGILISEDNNDKVINDLRDSILMLKDEKVRVMFKNKANEYTKENLYSWNTRIDMEIKYLDRVIYEK